MASGRPARPSTTASAQAQWISFRSPRDLLLALYYCNPEDLDRPEATKLLPSRVLVRGAGDISSWLVERTVLPDLERWASQHGLNWEGSDRQKQDEEIPLVAVAWAGCWEYIDPLSTTFSHQRRAVTMLDAAVPEVEYVLYAKGKDEAQRVLDELHLGLDAGIRAVPLKLASDAEPQFYWLFASNQVPVAALRTATEAYWGAVSSADERWSVFVQWPYSLSVPASLLRRLDWGAARGHDCSKGGVVLMRKDGAPQVLAAEGRASPALDLWMVSRLLGNRLPIQAPPVADEPRRDFDVELRLVTPRPEDFAKLEMQRLEAEIAERQARLKGLTEALGGGPRPFAEPLLLYFGDAFHRHFRDLIAEWADQPGELDQLRYAVIPAGALGQRFDQRQRLAYAVTTATALGELDAARSSAGARLALYAATGGLPGGDGMRFQLLPKWAKGGLHLFTRSDLELTLYPRWPVNEHTISCLSEAFFGHEEPGKVPVLLTRESSASERAVATTLHVPFQKLVGAPRLQLELHDVAPVAAHAAATVGKQGQQAFLDGLRGSFYDELEAKARGALSETFASVDRTLEQIRESILSTPPYPEVETALGQLHQELVELGSSLSTSSPTAIQRTLAALTSGTAALAKLREQLQQARKKVADAADHVGADRRAAEAKRGGSW
jgi:hypothetical protein